MSRTRWQGRRVALLLVLGLSGTIGLAALAIGTITRVRGESRVNLLPRSAARRATVHTRFNAGGQVESVEKTLIECELESVSLSSGGRTFTARGASRIIELIPEGSKVEKDEVLCRLDSSEFEEMVRQQDIKVLEARASRQRAAYNVKSAEIALVEYREGKLEQMHEDLAGRLTLAKSDISRQQDRVTWAERMVHNQYMSEGQLLGEKYALLKSQVNLRRIEGEKRKLERYEQIAAISRLETNVINTHNDLAFEEMRLRRTEELLEKFQTQVDRCTIRAPHEGLVVYANEPDSDPRVELGSTVYQKMDLFYLPNFNTLVVQAIVNETFLPKVSEGMSTRVRLEALPEHDIEGHVLSVSPLPLTQRGSRASHDVRSFLAKIKLHDVPLGIMPGMTAEVEIMTAHKPQALVIPTTAVKAENGHDICYIPSGEALERRVVEIQPADPDHVEVTAGLEEGEEVINDPYQVDESVTIVDAQVGLAGEAPELEPADPSLVLTGLSGPPR